MAKFTLTIETDNAAFISGLLSGVGGPSEVRGHSSELSEAEKVVVNGEVIKDRTSETQSEVEPKKRRGRPSKAEVAETPVEAPVEQPQAEAQPEKPADDLSDFLNDEPKITKQQMLDKLMAYGKAIGEKGRSEIEALLKSFGAAKFSELDEAKYTEVCAKVDQFLTSGK